MKTYTHMAGIDISKDWFDFALVDSAGTRLAAGRHPNSEAGYGRMFREVRKASGGTGEVLFCAEHTGIYSRPLARFAASRPGLALWMAHPAEVKRCMGAVRGKSDPADAGRIALYALRYRDKARLWAPEPQALARLRDLRALRGNLLRAAKAISSQLGEQRLLDPAAAKESAALCAGALKALEQALAAVEARVDAVLAQEAPLARNVALAQTVAGVGRQTALAIAMATSNFTAMTDPRKLACHAGVAPFEYSSGSSIKGRPRVSQRADKALKALLHLAALSAVRYDPQIREYYARKVAQGKHKMSVLNAVRFKVISRVLAVVKRGTPFAKDYSAAPS